MTTPPLNTRTTLPDGEPPSRERPETAIAALSQGAAKSYRARIREIEAELRALTIEKDALRDRVRDHEMLQRIVGVRYGED